MVHLHAMKSSGSIWRYWPATGLFVFDRVSSDRYTSTIHRREKRSRATQNAFWSNGNSPGLVLLTVQLDAVPFSQKNFY